MSNKNQIKNKKRFQSILTDDNQEFKEAFGLFDKYKKGKINKNELLEEMQSFNFKEKNPFVFNFFSNFNKTDVINYDDFDDAINEKLQEENSTKGIKKIFELFNNSNSSEFINSTDLYKIKNELEEIMTKEEFIELNKLITESGKKLNFNDFYEIMTNKD
jgi:Ca2+-binding EF-hand superfamily protein